MLNVNRKFTIPALVIALGILAPEVAGAATAGAVTVYRGAQMTLEPAAPSGPVEVLRGTPAPVSIKQIAAPSGGVTRLVAGTRLWLVDAKTGRLTTCAARRSTQVGRETIRCFSRDLPTRWSPSVD